MSPETVDGRFFSAHPRLSPSEVEQFTPRRLPRPPHAEPVAGHRACAALAEVHGPVDLVVVAVPPEDAIGLVAEAAGPNCLGLANNADDIRLNATFSPFAPVTRPTGLLSQSGAVDLNPVVATPGGAPVLDVKVPMTVPCRRPDAWLRRPL